MQRPHLDTLLCGRYLIDAMPRPEKRGCAYRPSITPNRGVVSRKLELKHSSHLQSALRKSSTLPSTRTIQAIVDKHLPQTGLPPFANLASACDDKLHQLAHSDFLHHLFQPIVSSELSRNQLKLKVIKMAGASFAQLMIVGRMYISEPRAAESLVADQRLLCAWKHSLTSL